MSESRTGYTTRTYRLKLYTKQRDWFEQTKLYYNDILKFYYELLINEETLLTDSNQAVMRQLEILTIGEKKKGIEPKHPIPFFKVPLYFRRAVINTAISLARSYITKRTLWLEGNIAQPPGIAKQFHASPIYYKGMYKEFMDDRVTLKLWNGEKWIWKVFLYTPVTKIFPQQRVILSPSLKITKDQILLHVPIQTTVADIRTVKERINEQENVCAVAFPGKNHFAVCAFFDKKQMVYDSHFVSGMEEWKQKQRQYIGKIKKSKEARGGQFDLEFNNRIWWEKIKNLNESYAHMASRRVIDACKIRGVKIIVVPNYENADQFHRKDFLTSSNYEWIGRRIIQYMKYKAFTEGIVVTTVRSNYTSNKCHICREYIKKYNPGYSPSKEFLGGMMYLCPNGHRGNVGLNTAKNLGQYFFQKFKEQGME